jgi:DNA-binding NarL/FixJ family response regulator
MVIVTLIRDTNRSPQYLSAAIAAGVHAAVPRAIDPRRLGEAIRRAHTDRRYLDPALAALTARPKRQPAQIPGQPAAPRAPMPLSRREYQVLQLVAEGLENSGIAKILFLSVETVRTHVKSILRKLSARDRTHAVTIAFRGGILITLPDGAHQCTPEPRAAAPSPH